MIPVLHARVAGYFSQAVWWKIIYTVRTFLPTRGWILRFFRGANELNGLTEIIYATPLATKIESSTQRYITNTTMINLLTSLSH